jgi:hypothetical protein
MSGKEQVESLKQQLLEAYVQREQADDKIKAIRAMMAGIPIGQALAQEAAPAQSETSDAA